MTTNDTRPEVYTSAHESLNADEIYRLFGSSRGMQLLRYRRMGNAYLQMKSLPPNKAHYDLAYESADRLNYLDDCNKAKAAREVHDARRGEQLADILRGMSFEEKEAYLYRSNN
jgi:hypothetical protein